ncbi:sugar ABC transporter substrate-binding protein [Leucobacter sp. CSA1]|uniref:Sugar ABC transporter substrate-binding protein n=1 Tax=Leucobacter chromiisoli TaxID=2796471 RepID=A0A934Q3J6_9MICO|nr:sugar ABC transporter substrate-binding protein [Leucobacter chromiisoli]MBK0417734.1 sugar ABC transporter substrate-binding protein [Leucobacter chromiisoli]
MKKISALVAAGALVFGLAACSSNSSADVPDAEFTVGVTFSDLSNPVWSELVQEAQSYGAEEGIAVNYVDAKGKSADQVTQIENFIQQDVDAIIICAVESQALVDVTKKAQEAGIKVVGYTQVLENYDAQYLVDAYNTGYANGEAAANWITENYGDEEVVEWGLMDLPEFPEIIDRANGIKDAVEELAPNAELVATNSALTAEDGVKNAENFLQANPDMKMIATIGGGGAQGGNEGVKASGITDYDSFGLFGIDATEIEIQNIINGDPQKSSVSLGGGKAHGRTLIDITSDLLNDEEVEKDQYMPITVIDESNAQEYFDEHFAD